MTTSTDTKLAWEAVADHLDALGLKLKPTSNRRRRGQGPAEEVSEAFERLGAAIETSFSAIGAAVEDSAVREGASNLAVALGNALADTLSAAGRGRGEGGRGPALRGRPGPLRSDSGDVSSVGRVDLSHRPTAAFGRGEACRQVKGQVRRGDQFAFELRPLLGQPRSFALARSNSASLMTPLSFSSPSLASSVLRPPATSCAYDRNA